MSFAPIAASPEAVGIPSAALAAFVRKLDAIDTLHTLTLMRHGQIALSMAWAPFDLDGKHILHSLSKSFTSLAVGFARAEGLLDIEKPLLSYLPEYAGDVTDERMKSVTLRHLLCMSSGHTVEPTGLVTQPEGAQDWCRAFISSPLQQEPGSVFTYNSLGTYMLAAVVRRVTGLNVREYLMPRLFEPLGILPGQWECCPQGTNLGGWGFMLSANDLAKVGQLLLQKGVWQGRRLLPADYLAEATRPQADNSANETPDWKVGYGFQFWMSLHGFRGDGAFGQYIVVVPEDDLVMVTTACLADMQQVLTHLWDMRKSFTPNELQENPSALQELRALCASRVIRPFAPKASCPPSGPLHGLRFEAAGWEMLVDANASEAAITFRQKDRFEQLRASFTEPLGAAFTLRLDDVSPHPYRAIARWEDAETLVITAVAMDTGWVDTYRIATGARKRLTRTTQFALGLGWIHRPASIDANA